MGDLCVDRGGGGGGEQRHLFKTGLGTSHSRRFLLERSVCLDKEDIPLDVVDVSPSYKEV